MPWQIYFDEFPTGLHAGADTPTYCRLHCTVLQTALYCTANFTVLHCMPCMLSIPCFYADPCHMALRLAESRGRTADPDSSQL
jgi:hypothetical protein